VSAEPPLPVGCPNADPATSYEVRHLRAEVGLWKRRYRRGLVFAAVVVVASWGYGRNPDWFTIPLPGFMQVPFLNDAIAVLVLVLALIAVFLVWFWLSGGASSDSWGSVGVSTFRSWARTRPSPIPLEPLEALLRQQHLRRDGQGHRGRRRAAVAQGLGPSR
jgi:hypothetical protein